MHRAFGLVIASALAMSGSAAAEEWGVVSGQVVYAGEPPAVKKLDITKDQEHCLGKGAILSEEWVVNPKNKGVKNVFVWLAPLEKGGKVPVHPSLAEIKEKVVDVDQPRCAFEPHAVVLREGQILNVKNSAPIPHNVKWDGSPNQSSGNVIVPAGSAHQIKDLKADRLPVQIACSIHPWMNGWVRVFDHPYAVVTDADGKFTLKDAPAGKYRLFVWHEGTGWLGGKAGSKGQEITIPAGSTLDLGKLELKKAD